jgi:serine/threonine-protein kinase
MDHPQEPRRIGPYRLEELLGRGGMGEVFRAFDERLRRPVAVKRVRSDSELTPGRRERFLREARMAARLSHPGIVQIHDLVFTDDGDWVVMEHVPGRSLAEVERRGGLALRQALEVARQIAEALAEAHGSGIVHRDLKAENVLLTETGRAKILDFGLAKDLTPEDRQATLTLEGEVMGTCHTMAPEQARGQPVGRPADLFSFGVLLYELVTGVSPFRGRTALESLHKVAREPHLRATALRPELPPGLADLLDRLLAKEPAERPADAAEVASTLTRLLAGGTTAGLGPPPAAETGDEAWNGGWDEALGQATTGSRLAPRVSSPTDSAPRGPARSRRGVGIAAAVLGLLAVAGLLVLGPQLTAREVLHVAVRVDSGDGDSGQDGDLRAAGAGVRIAALDALAGLHRTVGLDAERLGGGGSPAAIARALAADEILHLEVVPQGREATVTLSRLDAEGGFVAGEALVLALAPEQALSLANAVRAAVRRVYPERARSAAPAPEVTADDYAAWLELRRRVDGGHALSAEERQRLQGLLASSPRFLEGHLLAAEAARAAADLEEARSAARTAAGLDPGDARPLAVLLRIELDAGREAEAAEILTRLEELAPGDLRPLTARARWLERRGELSEARQLWQQAAERRPSWHHLRSLAHLEIRLGEHDAARRHLEAALAVSPGNPAVVAKLAELELLYGDLERAETLYRQLLERGPQRAWLNNLGQVLYLLGRWDEAAQTAREAVALDPDHTPSRLSWADAELAAGRGETAMALYRQIAEELQTSAASRTLSALERMTRAQALARLGEARGAVELTLETLADHGDNADVIYLAALVFSLTGDRNAALVHAQKARELGLDARWLHLPAFDVLADDPEFQRLRSFSQGGGGGGPPSGLAGRTPGSTPTELVPVGSRVISPKRGETPPRSTLREGAPEDAPEDVRLREVKGLSSGTSCTRYSYSPAATPPQSSGGWPKMPPAWGETPAKGPFSGSQGFSRPSVRRWRKTSSGCQPEGTPAKFHCTESEGCLADQLHWTA